MAVATAGGGTAATKSSSLLARLGAHADDVGDVAGAARRGQGRRRRNFPELDKLDFTDVGKPPKDFSKPGLTKRVGAQRRRMDREVSEANPA